MAASDENTRLLELFQVQRRSVHAFRLRLCDEAIGAMNIFGHDVGGLDGADLQIVQALANVAAIGLLQERTISGGEILTEQLQGALNSRIVIEQAKRRRRAIPRHHRRCGL